MNRYGRYNLFILTLIWFGETKTFNKDFEQKWALVDCQPEYHLCILFGLKRAKYRGTDRVVALQVGAIGPPLSLNEFFYDMVIQ